jgi:hypothetical protein
MFRCRSEVFRCLYFGAASRHACGRAFAAGARAGAPALGCICVRVISPLRKHRWAYHVCAGGCACKRGHFLWLRPVRPPHLPIVARRARAARARGARQGHGLHEGEGAPRVARPVHALGDPVRPIPPRRRRARLRRCRRCAAARGDGGVAGRRPRPSPARAWLARAADRRALGVGRSRPARPHSWRAGPRTTPSSRRCRRRPTGRASRHCEFSRRRARTAPPMRRRVVGLVVSTRARRARLGTCVCAYVCIRVRACAECSPAWAWACACACARDGGRASGGRRQGATFF